MVGRVQPEAGSKKRGTARGSRGPARGRRAPALLPALVLLAGCGARAGDPGLLRPPGDPRPDPRASLDGDARRWVESTLADLDLRERVAQLVMVWMTGGYAAVSSEEMERLAGLVEEVGIGGVVISVGTPYAYAVRLGHLQARARVPLLVASDFEAGAGFRVGGAYALPSLIRLGGATELPPAMALGAIGEERRAYEAGRVTAVEGRALGVHLAFAPVLDVNSDPGNPIINTRSFGDDPERVAALGAAWIRGAHAGGMLATAKHFPGHGDTDVDSHLALPAIPADRERLEAVELVPFRRAIEAGVDAVMTAHVTAPGILGPEAPPATLSPFFLTRLLREELGFRGVLFTDALDMAALVDEYGVGETAVRALEAGADVLLMPPDPRAAIESVVAAVEGGRLTPARIEASVRRWLELKARAGLHRGRRTAPGRVDRIVGIPSHDSLAADAARRSLTLPRDLERLVPLDTARVRRILSLTYARPADLAAGRAFDRRLGEGVPELVTARADPSTSPSRYDSLATRAESADAVVLSAYLRPGRGAGEIGLPEGLLSLLERTAAAGVPVAVLSFGDPYLLHALPTATTYLLAWGAAEVMQRAAADALLGRAPVTGRLPISLLPYHRRGEGSRRPLREEVLVTVAEEDEVGAREAGMDPAGLARLDRLLRTAVADSITPGAALAVGRSGRLVRLRGYGRLDYDPAASPADASTPYDLASLTKVVGTTTALMGLVEERRVELDAPVGRYLPEWEGGWKAEVTVRDLLLHRGGLPPFRPLWRELEGRAAYRDAIAAIEPAYPPGDSTVYSDLGFMALGFVVEEVTGRSLDARLRETVFEPLGMEETGFRPPPPLRARVAPTEVDTLFRGRRVRGEVHDENAHAMGGVAGHAGLFGSARDLARFADWILRAARGEASPAPLPGPGTVREFTRRPGPEAGRAHGWDVPGEGSSAGRLLSERAFGHTGFTGTSLWVDPALDLFVVLLTNRVNPTREERRHIPLRRAVHEIVAASITTP